MRIFKIAAYIVGGLLALIVLALVLVVVFVDPNDYRDDIARMVETETGRKLTLSGDLKLAVFPWVALETGPASLSDAPGFGDEPFVSIQDARVSVRLLPLLRGKVDVGKVALTQPRIRLITDSTGRTNWSDLGKKDEPAATPASEQPTEIPTIAGLEIQDASITMENRQENSRQVMRNFNVTTGRLASGEPFDFKTDFVFEQDASLSVKVNMASEITADLERNVHRLAEPTIDVNLSGQGYPAEGIPVQIRAAAIESDIGQETHRLEGFELQTNWKGDGYPASGIPIAVNAKELTADLAKQTLQLQDLQADVAGAKFTGMLAGDEILDAPRLNGRLTLAPVALREWLPKVGVELPTTRDENVLKTMSFASTVAMTKTSADLQDIKLQLDDTTATGSLGVADFAATALRFNLKVDRINADRYLPPPVEAPANANAKQADEPPTEIPVESLRKLNARGELQIGEAIFSGIKFTKLRLGVNGRDGKVRFHPAEASMYGGSYRGDIGLDATGEVARVSLDEHVSNIDFAPLFKDFFETDRVSGKGNANIKLTGAGRTTDDVMKTLDGTIDFKVLDGALEGADLWYEIRRARALLKQQAIPARSGPERTPFSSLQGTGTMNDGVLTNNDLTVAMQYLQVTGQGTVDIPKSALDYRLVASVLKIPREGAAPAAEQDLVDAQIPVKITGALSDPTVRPDIEGYLKGKVQETLDKEKTKLEEKVKDKIGDKLKDLLRR
ncbi:MAG TPA: AsmA family protein [Steroidobacteraceae bacterium]|nr:AsmA family protein [Steroidobacteraceae bacterium]